MNEQHNGPGWNSPEHDASRNTLEPDEDGVIDPPPTASPPASAETATEIPSVTLARPRRLSRPAITVLLLSILMLGVIGAGVLRYATGHDDAKEQKKQAADMPSAAAMSPRRLDLGAPVPASMAASGSPSGASPAVPGIRPLPGEVDPIGVRRTGSDGVPKPPSPEDAPVLLVSSGAGLGGAGLGGPGLGGAGLGGGKAGDAVDVSGSGLATQRPVTTDAMSSTRRSLEAYQRQLQGMMDSLGQGVSLAGQATSSPLNSAMAGSGEAASSGAAGSAGPRVGANAAGLFGGELAKSATPRVLAGQLGDRSLVLPKGTSFTCALKTRVVSAASGLLGCQVQRNVYSDNGRVLLIERGSHLDGEYRMTSVRPGTVRIPVLWTRIRTPNGVTVDIDSPGTGPLGESGIDGHVDNRWGERIGAALLLSVIDDAVKLVIQNQSSEGAGNTVILPSTTSNTSKLAEKVLDSTINIPPLIYQNQGGIVGIYVARDVDFSSVYQLETTDPGAP